MRATKADSYRIKLTDLPAEAGINSMEISITNYDSPTSMAIIKKCIVPHIVGCINNNDDIKHIWQKISHGCWDVYCQQCDGPPMQA